MTNTNGPFQVEVDQDDIDALSEAVHLAWSSDYLRSLKDHERMDAAIAKIIRQIDDQA